MLNQKKVARIFYGGTKQTQESLMICSTYRVTFESKYNVYPDLDLKTYLAIVSYGFEWQQEKRNTLFLSSTWIQTAYI